VAVPPAAGTLQIGPSARASVTRKLPAAVGAMASGASMPVAKMETAAKADVINNVAASNVTSMSDRNLMFPP
jgi:hypothetical protein